MTNQGEDLKYLTKDYWTGRWEGNNSPWHRVEVSPLLAKYISLLDGGKKDLKFFVPLCGKTIDLKWLFDQGHRVVGVDGYQNALENFFKEHSMEYTVQMKNGIPVFTEKSGRIVLYCCNIFDFDKSGEGAFDAVWDRASFGAINSGERARYVDLLINLKTQNAPHLLELYEYDDQTFKEYNSRFFSCLVDSAVHGDLLIVRNPVQFTHVKGLGILGYELRSLSFLLAKSDYNHITVAIATIGRTSSIDCYNYERYDVKFIESYPVPDTAQRFKVDWCNINLFFLTLK